MKHKIIISWNPHFFIFICILYIDSYHLSVFVYRYRKFYIFNSNSNSNSFHRYFFGKYNTNLKILHNNTYIYIKVWWKKNNSWTFSIICWRIFNEGTITTAVLLFPLHLVFVRAINWHVDLKFGPITGVCETNPRNVELGRKELSALKKC